MKFLSILKQSIKSIMSNKVRSFLTVLGIIIGIGSVIGLMSLGAGVQESISREINSLGSTNLMITSGVTAYSKSSYMSSDDASKAQQNNSAMMGSVETLTQNDLTEVAQISKELVSNVAGYVSSPVIFKVGDEEQRQTLIGVSDEYFALYDLKIVSGNGLEGSKVRDIVLGSQLATDTFGDTSAIGQKISIMGTEFTVVGVLEAQEESSFSNPNLQAYISDSDAFKIFDSKNYNGIVAKATSEKTVDSAKAELETVLLRSHKIDDKDLADFTVTSSKDLLSTIDTVMSMLTSFLAGIAAISLLVGGIGIMNIMLVSVTERTREIGLRKALGAKTVDILIQFMTEAVVLTVIGGVLGMTFGYTIGIVAGKFLDFSAVITLDSVLLAVGISSFIGIVFGIYPAARAARLNPIDALRYE